MWVQPRPSGVKLLTISFFVYIGNCLWLYWLKSTFLYTFNFFCLIYKHFLPWICKKRSKKHQKFEYSRHWCGIFNILIAPNCCKIVIQKKDFFFDVNRHVTLEYFHQLNGFNMIELWTIFFSYGARKHKWDYTFTISAVIFSI